MATVVVNYKKTSDYDVSIMRPSLYQNPYHIGKDGTREEVIKKHWDYLISNHKLLKSLRFLKDKRLGCCCAPLQCHGNNYVKILDTPGLYEEILRILEQSNT